MYPHLQSLDLTDLSKFIARLVATIPTDSSETFVDYSIGEDQKELIEAWSKIYVLEESFCADTTRDVGDKSSVTPSLERLTLY